MNRIYRAFLGKFFGKEEKACRKSVSGTSRKNKTNRLIPRERGRINVRGKNSPSRVAYLFFFLCDLPWWKLFLMMALCYIIFNLIFGVLFYSIGGGMSYKNREEVLSFWTCFFFSIQTMDTIGYGLLSPLTWGCDVITMLCSILANFFWCWFCGLVFAKMSFPKKLKYTHKYSHVAVMNSKTLIYKGEAYLAGYPSITFRVAPTYSSSELCDGDLHLIYFKTTTTADGWENYEFHELDFEINRQLGRPREMNLSTPLLALPWTVTHAIDDKSPLNGKSLEDMAEEHGEIIAVIDGIDEISSQNYQSRWSYIPREILSHRKFQPCVKRDVGCYLVDFSKLSQTLPVNEKQLVESDEVMDELISLSENFPVLPAPRRFSSGPVTPGLQRSSQSQIVRRVKTENDLTVKD